MNILRIDTHRHIISLRLLQIQKKAVLESNLSSNDKDGITGLMHCIEDSFFTGNNLILLELKD